MSEIGRPERAGVRRRTSWLGAMLGWVAILVASLFRSTPIPATGKSGRAADVDVDTQSARAAHRQWGTLFVFCAYVVALLGGVAFLYSYWAFDKITWDAAHTAVLGGTLAVFLGGFGLGLVLYAHWLMRHQLAIEPREILPSPPEEREAAQAAFSGGEIQRRSLLIGMAVSAVGVFGAIFVSMMRSMASPPTPSLFDTVWKRGQRLTTLEGKPVTVDFLQPGTSTIVFPEDQIGSEKAQTVLLRVAEGALRLPAERANWAPQGYLAYSRVCTHAGCPVGMFEVTTDQLMCPCHQSTFDVLRAAQPTGGPAARPLPQLPLYVDDKGILRAAGEFSAPPGPGFWGIPS